MTLTPDQIQDAARRLHDAERSRSEIDPLIAEWPALGTADAYRIQRALVALYDQPLVGLKAALTSAAKQKAMGVDQPGFGTLLPFMRCEDSIVCGELIHPRVEPEIALFFHNFDYSPGMPAVDVAFAASAFAPALEVIDSRYRKFKFSAADVFADNCSSSRYIVSPDLQPLPFDELNLAGVVLRKNGDIVHTGTPAAVLGSPFASAAFVLNLAAEHGVELPPSFVLLTGGITKAVPVAPGDVVSATFGGIGHIALAAR